VIDLPPVIFGEQVQDRFRAAITCHILKAINVHINTGIIINSSRRLAGSNKYGGTRKRKPVVTSLPVATPG
jgi:hypothetical protein